MNSPNQESTQATPTLELRLCAGAFFGLPLGYLVFALMSYLPNAPLPAFSLGVSALSVGSILGILLSRHISLFLASCALSGAIIYFYWGAFAPFFK